jgi:5'-nucleotidase
MTLATAAEHYKAHELEPYIETATGKRFYIDRPTFEIQDIAHALGNQCRYTGHTKQFYSVAEHSVLVAQIVADLNLGDPFEGLMHDAAEAYLSDIASPWKTLLPDYKVLEDRIERPLRQWAGLPEVLSEGVKRADWLALFIEARFLMPSKAEEWIAPEGIKEEAKDLPYQIRCFSPTFAKSQFWHRYNELSAARQR